MPRSAGGEATWSVAQHDTIPSVEFWHNPLEAHVYLAAFLDTAGDNFSPPYSAVRESIASRIREVEARNRRRQRPSATVTDQRLRTWKKVFEDFGLLRADESGIIRLTRLGEKLDRLNHELNGYLEGANDQLAQLAVDTLSRHLLRNPLDTVNYPEDADLHPFRFIWRAMRRLDDKLHWEEMNRVIMKVLYERDTDDAVERIRQVRHEVNGAYDRDTVTLLGTPAVEEGSETKRRITPWFTRAGFGGLLIEPMDDEQGFRRIVSAYKPLIDEAVAQDILVPPAAHTDRDTYIRYITDMPSGPEEMESGTDEDLADRVLTAVSRYGESKIICLSGLPGTGKSRLAKMVAQQLTDGDPYRFDEVQFHESTSYEDFMEGFVPSPSGHGFELVPKVFRLMNRRAALDPVRETYVLLIEEFTRTNIHAVLGELMTYVEHRDRRFRLALSQEEISVAPNLVIIATMNPMDKSAMRIDAAIFRRLHQMVVEPSPEALRDMLEGDLDASVLDRLTLWYDEYVAILPFGHGAFAGVRSEEEIRSVWQGTIRYFLTDVTGAVKEQFVEAEHEFPWR